MSTACTAWPSEYLLMGIHDIDDTPKPTVAKLDRVEPAKARELFPHTSDPPIGEDVEVWSNAILDRLDRADPAVPIVAPIRTDSTDLIERVRDLPQRITQFSTRVVTIDADDLTGLLALAEGGIIDATPDLAPTPPHPQPERTATTMKLSIDIVPPLDPNGPSYSYSYSTAEGVDVAAYRASRGSALALTVSEPETGRHIAFNLNEAELFELIDALQGAVE